MLQNGKEERNQLREFTRKRKKEKKDDSHKMNFDFYKAHTSQYLRINESSNLFTYVYRGMCDIKDVVQCFAKYKLYNVCV